MHMRESFRQLIKVEILERMFSSLSSPHLKTYFMNENKLIFFGFVCLVNCLVSCACVKNFIYFCFIFIKFISN